MICFAKSYLEAVSTWKTNRLTKWPYTLIASVKTQVGNVFNVFSTEEIFAYLFSLTAMGVVIGIFSKMCDSVIFKCTKKQVL